MDTIEGARGAGNPAVPKERNGDSSIITSETILDCALTYARNGFRVLPLHTPDGKGGCSCEDGIECSKIGKHPRAIGKWTKQASSDESTVCGWWKRWPEANIGLVLDDLAVLDVDIEDSFNTLEAEHEPLERLTRQQTGSGGWHYMFAACESVKTNIDFRTGLDFKTGSGGYIVVEPSLHQSGRRYRWSDEPTPLKYEKDNIALQRMPDWLIDAINGKAKAAKGAPLAARPAKRKAVKRILLDHLNKVKADEGRNTSGFSFFCQLRDNDYTRDEAKEILKEWMVNVTRIAPEPPYTNKEASDSLKQAYDGEKRDPSPANDGITQNIAASIQEESHFAKDEGELLYVFEGGVYKPSGEKFIRQAVKHYCEESGKGKSWTPELATKVAVWITADAPELWTKPSIDVLNCLNGLLNVRTMKMSPHSPDHLSAIQINAVFDPDAKCPEVDKFVSEVFCGDSRGVPFEIAAWLMLPDTSIQKAVLAVGEGANGKSVFLGLIQTFIGQKNVSALSLHKIESDKFAAARLYSKLANICSDLPTAALSGTSMFKALTGGDTINGERKFEASFEFRPYARLLFSANSLPRSDDHSQGFFRRWLVIPFTKRFDDASKSTVPRAVLDARLSTPNELSGMLNRALKALPQIQLGRFTESASMREALDEFRKTTDPFAVWLEANTVENAEGFVTKESIRAAYTEDCRDAGRPVPSESAFTERLRSLRPNVKTGQRRVNGKKPWCYNGIVRVAEEYKGGSGELAF